MWLNRSVMKTPFASRGSEKTKEGNDVYMEVPDQIRTLAAKEVVPLSSLGG